MPLAFRNAVNNSALDLMGGLGDPDLTATDYTLGICSNSQQKDLAQLFSNSLTGKDSVVMRKKIGFEF